MKALRAAGMILGALIAVYTLGLGAARGWNPGTLALAAACLALIMAVLASLIPAHLRRRKDRSRAQAEASNGTHVPFDI